MRLAHRRGIALVVRWRGRRRDNGFHPDVGCRPDETLVEGDQRTIIAGGEDDIGRIVGADVVPERPDVPQQRRRRFRDFQFGGAHRVDGGGGQCGGQTPGGFERRIVRRVSSGPWDGMAQCTSSARTCRAADASAESAVRTTAQTLASTTIIRVPRGGPLGRPRRRLRDLRARRRPHHRR